MGFDLASGRYGAVVSELRAWVVAERYRLVGELGRGGMGRVWAARDELLGRDVAVKELVLPTGMAPEDKRDLVERTIREARAIARLDHRNVVRIFDVVFAGGRPWIVMELVRSRSLFEVVSTDGPMPPEQVARVGLEVLAALRAAHRGGILHRDVKPANVLLGDDGRVVLTDFGLATAAGDSSMTSTGIVLGSPSYLAPERTLDGEIGPAADLWSLGATLYAAVEGKPPYAKSTPMATLAAVATEPPTPPKRAGVMGPALAALLERDPKRRADAELAERLLREAASGARSREADSGAWTTTGAWAAAAETRTAAGYQSENGNATRGTAARGAAGSSAAENGGPGNGPIRSSATGNGMTRSGAAPNSTAPNGAVPNSAVPNGSPQNDGSTGGYPDRGEDETQAGAGTGKRTRTRWLVVAAVIALMAVVAVAVRPMLDKAEAKEAPTPSPSSTTATDLPPATFPAARPGHSHSHSASPHPSRSPARAKSAPATAKGPAGKPIQNFETGTCLYAPGTTGELKLWACKSIEPQLFSFAPDGTMRVRGKCVAITSGDDGAHLKLAACNGDASQQFSYNDSYDLVSGAADKCVDVPDGNPSNGTPAQIWPCNGTGNQKWHY